MAHEKIGYRIRQLRCERGLSQEELARQVDLPRTAITKIETGSQDVRFKELEKLSEALGISLGNLVEERRPVRQGADDEFFRSGDVVAAAPSQESSRQLRTVLLIILERCAGNPKVDQHLLVDMVNLADRMYHEFFGTTVTDIPLAKADRNQVIETTIADMLESNDLSIVHEHQGSRRCLPLVTADLRTISAAKYLAIEKAVCQLSTMGT